MKLIVCLPILILIYYQIFHRLPHLLSTKTHIIFALFIIISLIIYYIVNYHKAFAYKVLNNMHDVHNKPLYDFQGIHYKNNQMDLLKNNLAMKQGWRCMNCQNPILQKDINHYNVNYVKPLKFGGQNDINNLGLCCSTCNSFKPY